MIRTLTETKQASNQARHEIRRTREIRTIASKQANELSLSSLTLSSLTLSSLTLSSLTLSSLTLSSLTLSSLTLAMASLTLPEAFWRPIRVASLNVHAWHGPSGKNLVLVADLVREHRIDIIALQEAIGGEQVARLARNLGYHHVRAHANALLSRWPLARQFTAVLPFHRGTVFGLVRVPFSTTLPSSHEHEHEHEHDADDALPPPTSPTPTVDLRVHVTHLDHMYEPTRVRQLRHVLDIMNHDATGDDGQSKPTRPLPSPISNASECEIERGDALSLDLDDLARFRFHEPAVPRLLIGDFNSLFRRDYSQLQWDEIARVRERGRWEAPFSHVMDALLLPPPPPHDAARSEPLLVDSRTASTIDVPAANVDDIATCRFNTRIDYILMRRVPSVRFVPGSYRVIDCSALTDHHMVVVDLELRFETPHTATATTATTTTTETSSSPSSIHE